MANTKFQLKRSVVPGKIPQASDLEIGEIALNLSDQKGYTKHSTGNVIVLFDYLEANSAYNTAVLAYQKANSAITLGNTPLYLGGTNTSITGLNSITSNTLVLTGNVVSTNTKTGSLVVTGGVGVTGDIDITGDYKVNGVKFNSYLYNATIGDGSNTSINVTHNLNKTDIIVSVRETISGIMVYPAITFVNSNTIKFDFVTAPTLNQYSVSMIALPNNEASYSANVGNGTDSVLTVNHNLNKTNILTSVKENVNGVIVYPDISYLNSNSLTLTFVYSPSANQYSVSIIGL